ncbi:hypothetical protein FMEAI12_3640045 [Parafrankia sp. Ea1.12]|nr:hypothetical protein FMEAI12_3640045 [Parafrankia sp. Ea1.12]
MTPYTTLVIQAFGGNPRAARHGRRCHRHADRSTPPRPGRSVTAPHLNAAAAVGMRRQAGRGVPPSTFGERGKNEWHSR